MSQTSGQALQRFKCPPPLSVVVDALPPPSTMGKVQKNLRGEIYGLTCYSHNRAFYGSPTQGVPACYRHLPIASASCKSRVS